MIQLITDALIVNGDGQSEPFAGDVLIHNDRIVRVGYVSPSAARSADRIVSADGRVLSPGFVDTHNHGAIGGTHIGKYGIPIACELSVRGGVTKRICGADGLSPAPVVPEQRAEYATQLAPLDGRMDTPPDPLLSHLQPSAARSSRRANTRSGQPADARVDARSGQPVDANQRANANRSADACITNISSSNTTTVNPSGTDSPDGEWPWTTMAEFYQWHRGRSVTDMGMHLGHSAVRRVVMSNLDRVATDEQIRDMCEVVRREAPWALGLSTGLIYSPAVSSDQREITALVRAFNEVKPGALFPHLRSESDGILQALDEVITSAVDGGGAYCNEHSKIAGKHNWDKFQQVASRLSDAASNVATIENMYPWPAGNTTGDAIFPPEMRAGSRYALLARLSSLAVRDRLYQKMRGDTTSWDNFVYFCGGLDGIQIAGAKPGVGDFHLGRSLGDLARDAGHADLESREAYEAVFEFFLANKGEVSIISHYGDDAVMERFFRRPTMALCTDGLIPGPGQKPHPRSLGAFPKALRMAREMGIPLKEIVYRMSVMPCRFLGLDDPTLRPGADASLVLFDWHKVRECNTFDYPLVPPEGIEAVWVHGQLVNEQGRIHPPAVFPGRHLLTNPSR